MSNISKAYADALFELSIEENILEEIKEQTALLLQVLADNADFVKLLTAPTVTKEEKIKLTDGVFSEKINKHLLNFIKVMIQRKDTAEMKNSFTDFEKLYNKHNNIVLTNKVDPACLGGVILQLEDKQFNDSISGKLETLKNQLKA